MDKTLSRAGSTDLLQASPSMIQLMEQSRNTQNRSVLCRSYDIGLKLPKIKPSRVSQSIEISARDYAEHQCSRGSLDAVPSLTKPKTIIYSQPKSATDKYSFVNQVQKAARLKKGPADYKVIDLEGFRTAEQAK